MNFTIGKKVVLGYAAMIGLLLVLAFVSVLGTSRLMDNSRQVIAGNTLKGSMLQREADHLNWANKLSEYIYNPKVKQFKGKTDHKTCKLGSWLYSHKRVEAEKLTPSLAAAFRAMEEPHRKFHESAITIKTYLASGDNQKAAEIFNYTTLVEISKLKKLLHDVIKITSENIMNSEAMFKIGNIVQYTSILLSIIAVAFGALLSFLLTKEVVRPLAAISVEIDSFSTDVASAANELSQASQGLALSSSNQASSVQQASAAIEHLGGSVEKNLEDAEVGKDSIDEVNTNISLALDAMNLLISSMDRIESGNADIQRLVGVISEIGEKTEMIDEIVFQTKLLSFNASVEAERAGEHGRGFAVVAQEVGSLAEMSGKSASEISKIVKESVGAAKKITEDNERRVTRGNGQAKDVAKFINLVHTVAIKSKESSEKIHNSSQVQVGEIKRLNQVTTDIDKTTQQNAATAEEAASTSEELSGQSMALKEVSSKLRKMVFGDEAVKPSTSTS
ncbi:MAG: CZB domain-containing protein [Bacteriovoracaceae bacterium]|nr:CZB domain-containing protein [Bacteriovoracaceae bacterium]